jgi:aspartyl-tRNA(Asn)/glutamyl-tRNA(Gln) amidotransferase subunit A
MDLTDLTLTQAAALLRRKEISPVELASAHLERIQALDGRLNCFITLTPELALEAARRAEAALQAGEMAGPLHGLPLALKDLFETRGVRTTAGSTFFADWVPERDAVVVEKLLAAGAVILGKLNMHEIALGVTNVNPHYGPSRNPWDPERMTGGSSGGSAGALAARLCLGSLGSDTGGSIRIPASLCGVVGLKPTYGRASLRGVVPLSWNLDHPGPMGRSVRDVALLLGVIAGYDPFDPASADIPVEDYLAAVKALTGGDERRTQLEGSSLRGTRIALASDEFFTRAVPEVMDAVQKAAQVFSGLGAQVEAVEIPGGRQAALANGLMTTSDAAAFHRERLAEHPQGFGADVLQRLQAGAAYTSSEYILARRTQAEFRRGLERLFERYHLLLTPTTPVAAPPIEGPDAIEQARLLTRFTAPFNLSGLPALSLPCGFTPQGLPIGLQIVARPWDEARVLAAAACYEAAAGWRMQPPIHP